MATQEILKQSIEVLPYAMKLPSRHVWFDYDKEADVMYISFQKPQQASDTEVLDNGVLIRRQGNKIIGLTILNARKFQGRKVKY